MRRERTVAVQRIEQPVTRRGRPDQVEAFQQTVAGVPRAIVGEVVASDRLKIIGLPQSVEIDDGDATEECAPLVVHAELGVLKEEW